MEKDAALFIVRWIEEMIERREQARLKAYWAAYWEEQRESWRRKDAEQLRRWKLQQLRQRQQEIASENARRDREAKALEKARNEPDLIKRRWMLLGIGGDDSDDEELPDGVIGVFGKDPGIPPPPPALFGV
jgi:hypothetical protein